MVAGGNWVMQTVAFKLTPDFTLNATNLAPTSVAAGVAATSTVTVARTERFHRQRSVVLHHYSGSDSATDLRLRSDYGCGRFRHFRSDRQHHCDHDGGWLHGDCQRCGRIRDSHQGSQPDGYRAGGSGFHHRCLAALSGYSGGRSIVYFDGHDWPGQWLHRGCGFDLHRRPRRDSRSDVRIQPSLSAGRHWDLNADGKYDGSDHGIARTAIERPLLRHAAADWRLGAAGNRNHFT